MNKIFERNIKGELTYETSYEYLYHMTDHHGFGYTIDQNALKSLRGDYISTTFNPKMNTVYGHSHLSFKFVLYAKPLSEKYGSFTYDYHSRVSGTDEYVSLNEDEIGINTKNISPFSSYLKGTILMFDLFSQTGLQWLLYDNNSYKGLFDQKSAAPRAIEALYTHIFKWKKPIWIGEDARSLTKNEIQFLKEVFKIHKKGGDFKSGLRDLVDRFPIKNFWGKTLDSQMVFRRQQSKKIMELINSYFAGRKYREVDPNEVKKIISKSLDILNLNNNIKNVLMSEFEKHGLFHPVYAPVDWTSIFNDIMDGDIDEAIDTIEWIANRKKRNIEWWESDPHMQKYTVHDASMMA